MQRRGFYAGNVCMMVNRKTRENLCVHAEYINSVFVGSDQFIEAGIASPVTKRKLGKINCWFLASQDDAMLVPNDKFSSGIAVDDDALRVFIRTCNFDMPNIHIVLLRPQLTPA